MSVTRTYHRFRRKDIEALPPDLSGCYALYSGDICVYVGVGRYRERLLAHLRGDNYCITLHRPTRWIQYHGDDPEAVAQRLIRELQPRCNPRLPSEPSGSNGGREASGNSGTRPTAS